MADTLDPKFLDKRTTSRYVTGGQLDEKAYERHLKALPDLHEKSSPIETAMADEDFDDDDFEDEDEVDEMDQGAAGGTEA